MVIGAYLDGEINLGKAAELQDMHRLELQERFIAQSIPVRTGPDAIREARVELATNRALECRDRKDKNIMTVLLDNTVKNSFGV